MNLLDNISRQMVIRQERVAICVLSLFSSGFNLRSHADSMDFGDIDDEEEEDEEDEEEEEETAVPELPFLAGIEFERFIQADDLERWNRHRNEPWWVVGEQRH
ncbi:hypothetical protein CDL15_Pgr015451 [Punica granatum]|uniref:Uncharacterized protein n=1 Tax=Punica granatum TaxID=22663 RepID=A0A218VZU5_PUNGR|nr:hypothetical protein CDL15_Pgr015451 [Punica granatum]